MEKVLVGPKASREIVAFGPSSWETVPNLTYLYILHD